ncbi:hypothetical protein AYI68_g5728 [Smittium mucronatum]|uniref:Uncharacterized protein n=1 Tax=Smittium mucronatum TaxID=133383 RepID=A0A1R0GTH6_9FUNG|nr:hypothetical protein AYI68_g5728 [Smittium mucronatum]
MSILWKTVYSFIITSFITQSILFIYNIATISKPNGVCYDCQVLCRFLVIPTRTKNEPNIDPTHSTLARSKVVYSTNLATYFSIILLCIIYSIVCSFVVAYFLHVSQQRLENIRREQPLSQAIDEESQEVRKYFYRIIKRTIQYPVVIFVTSILALIWLLIINQRIVHLINMSEANFSPLEFKNLNSTGFNDSPTSYKNLYLRIVSNLIIDTNSSSNGDVIYDTLPNTSINMVYFFMHLFFTFGGIHLLLAFIFETPIKGILLKSFSKSSLYKRFKTKKSPNSQTGSSTVNSSQISNDLPQNLFKPSFLNIELRESSSNTFICHSLNNPASQDHHLETLPSSDSNSDTVSSRYKDDHIS